MFSYTEFQRSDDPAYGDSGFRNNGDYRVSLTDLKDWFQHLLKQNSQLTPSFSGKNNQGGAYLLIEFRDPTDVITWMCRLYPDDDVDHAQALELMQELSFQHVPEVN